MGKYNNKLSVADFQQNLVNLIDYVLTIYNKGYITERTKDELLKRINPEVKEGYSSGKTK